MTFKRSISVAFGTPGNGGVVLGGENTKYLSVLDWDISGDYQDGPKANVMFSVRGVPISRLDGGISFPYDKDYASALHSAVLQCLKQENANFAIAIGSMIEVTDAVITATNPVVITSASNPFYERLVGMPIDIEGVGSFQISEYVNQGQVKASLFLTSQYGTPNMIGYPIPIPEAASGLTARIGYPFHYCCESLRVGGIRGRSTITPVKEDLDGLNYQSYILHVEHIAPANDNRDAGRKYASFSQSTDESGYRTLNFVGVYTALANHTALTAYATYLNTWITTAVALLSTPDIGWEQTTSNVTPNDDNTLLAFTVNYREIPFPKSIADPDVAWLKNMQVGYTKNSEWTLGVRGKVRPSIVQVFASTNVDKGTYSWDELYGVYKDTIKPNLLSGLVDLFGSNPVIRSEQPIINASANTIGAFLTVLVLGNTNLVHFARETQFSLRHSLQIRHKLIKKYHNYRAQSHGPMIYAKVTTDAVFQGAVNYGSPAILSSVFATGYKPQAPGEASDLPASSDGLFSVPGDPPFPEDVKAGASGWTCVSCDVLPAPTEQSRSDDAYGTVYNVCHVICITEWLWGDVELVEVLEPEIGAEDPTVNKIKSLVPYGSAPGYSKFDQPALPI